MLINSFLFPEISVRLLENVTFYLSRPISVSKGLLRIYPEDVHLDLRVIGLWITVA